MQGSGLPAAGQRDRGGLPGRAGLQPRLIVCRLPECKGIREVGKT